MQMQQESGVSDKGGFLYLLLSAVEHVCVCVGVLQRQSDSAIEAQLNRKWKDSQNQQSTSSWAFGVYMCVHEQRYMYVLILCVSITTQLLVQCVYKEHDANGCLVSDTENRLAPPVSFCSSGLISVTTANHSSTNRKGCAVAAIITLFKTI